jgi:hypothetical protein
MTSPTTTTIDDMIATPSSTDDPLAKKPSHPRIATTRFNMRIKGFIFIS